MFRRRTVALLLISAAISTASCRAGKSEDDINLLRARETVLRDDLYQLRKSIELYAVDHNALPQSLDDLVKAGYLREIPDDPMTERQDWKITTSDKGKKGIADVHSASTAKSTEGSLYSDW